MESAVSCRASCRAIFSGTNKGTQMNPERPNGRGYRALSRRTLLRGVGVSLSLPLLNVMAPAGARAQGTTVPRRMFGICNNLGVLPSEFFPSGDGQAYTPSPYLKLLQDHRKDFTVFS